MCFLSHMTTVYVSACDKISCNELNWTCMSVGAGDKQNFIWNLYTGLYNPLRKSFLRGHPAHFIECNEIIQTSSVKWATSPHPAPTIANQVGGTGWMEILWNFDQSIVSWRLLFVDRPAFITVSPAPTWSATVRHTLPLSNGVPNNGGPKWPQKCHIMFRYDEIHFTIPVTESFMPWPWPIEVFNGSDHHAKIATSNIQITLMNGTFFAAKFRSKRFVVFA